jgi:chromosome segregation ATPase
VSKAVTQGSHWLPRKSQYSLHAQRNGRVDVLPPGAAEQLYAIADQIADGNARIEKLRQERNGLEAELHSLGRLDGLRLRHTHHDPAPHQRLARLRARIADIETEMRQVRKHVGSLKATLTTTQEANFECAFVRVAKAELAPDTFKSLSDKAALLVARAKARQ